MSPLDVSMRPRDVSPMVLGDRVYELVAAEIVAGRIAPGEMLREAEVAEHLGMSRTPVREGLRRLAEMGLVRIEPNRGYRAAPLDLQLLTETAVVFGELCGTAARLAAPHLQGADIDWLATVERRVFDEVVEETPEINRLLAVGVADLFLSRCENSVLVETTGRLRPHVLRAYHLHGRDLPRTVVAERVSGIAGAARSRDGDLLSASVRVHCTQTLLDVLDVARKAGQTT